MWHFGLVCPHKYYVPFWPVCFIVIILRHFSLVGKLCAILAWLLYRVPVWPGCFTIIIVYHITKHAYFLQIDGLDIKRFWNNKRKKGQKMQKMTNMAKNDNACILDPRSWRSWGGFSLNDIAYWQSFLNDAVLKRRLGAMIYWGFLKNRCDDAGGVPVNHQYDVRLPRPTQAACNRICGPPLDDAAWLQVGTAPASTSAAIWFGLLFRLSQIWRMKKRMEIF